MPLVALPPDFNNNSQLGDNSTVRGVAAFIQSNSQDRADIYIGLKMDGYKEYINVSVPRPDIRMTFSAQPYISCESALWFNPVHDKRISLQV